MFWKKKPKLKTLAYVLVSEEECAKAFVEDVQHSLSNQRAALVISHFTATHERVQQQLESAGISCKTLTSMSDLNAGRLESLYRMNCVPLIPFPLLQMASPFPEKTAASLGAADVYVPEMHPTRRRDELVASFTASIPFDAQLILYAAIRSPLLSSFMNPEQMEALLKNIGISPQERVEHGMLTSSLFKAQQKIEKQVQSEQEAASQQEWMQKNMP